MNPHYTQEQIIHWLAWLAQQMKQHYLTDFSFDQIYKDWIPSTRGYQFLCYAATIVLAFVVGCAIGVGYFFTFWAIFSIGDLNALRFIALWFGGLFGAFSTPLPQNVNGTVSVKSIPILSLFAFISSGILTLILEILVIILFTFNLLIVHQIDKILYTLLPIVSSILLAGFMFGLFLILLSTVGGTRPIKSKPHPPKYPYQGGYAEYIVSRLLLSIAGCMPVRYSRFLDHMTSYMLLHKIGHNYFFIHPLLLDYFVNNYNENHPKS